MYGYPIDKTASPSYSKHSSTIEVLGEGTVTATPNRAVVDLGVVTDGPNLQAIQAENAKAISNIIQSVMSLNIPREKIQTQDYRIEIVYDYVDGKQIFRGYKITHLLRITTDHVDQTGKLVDTAVANGANQVTSIQFTIAHPEFYENQALSVAIQHARQKAYTIANTLGVTLGAIPSQVQESPRPAGPIPYMATAKFAASAVETPIEPGQLTIKAAVRVWFHFA
ncbi:MULTISPECIES: SIMPL domain-containing protein [Paenibacillus]|uniref:SIMPL domain-containing protein n=1 Tax=Paenibacillus violae TaxID=3077234 RepID=A0ABU3RAA2_9BACL|nr:MULTISPECIES: SIMPL domain-containing protein [Paenibacillus]MDU0201172.1 SIMPL domain-containing protein [Paenibacillus sp. PFR10]MEC0265029.1 SIMPL domain-containing protein [Paenibacillus anseongense]